MIHETTRVVPPDHPAFAGHFPGRPVLPGVVLLAWALEALEAATGWPATACDIASAKFLCPVGPGTPLTLRHTLQPSGTWRFDVLAGAGTVATGTVRTFGPNA
ncbi:3-hydroxylacyl-ACP dehydratase [Thauera chlorobenzoica]|uniref:(3R)-hydroxymyristoyl-[ACP] dehydratase n=1 Tax=Thauera chlorobenzoica TaxID=96773 RepID=A0A1H5UJ77_9RHOO|nr:3-hydroxylacyl-ACP dehydratase [Thauera chlorobenzoica]APR03605.1 (3R)-hydroxymyristoyl-[ACP] dehydratase [Thauera chlorobenzoica]SEF75085.1 3-hydroxymyristoyl/3-hydroxydecanoyl-(acyl carrier protein) dehydratase [Thauera chlorobenzoica]